MRFADDCGFVSVTVAGAARGPIEVLRRGFHVLRLPAEPSGERTFTIGAADNDEIRLQVGTGPEFEHVYHEPDGCAAPAIVTLVHDGCDGNSFVFVNNRESAPVTGVVTNRQGQRFPVTIPAGKSTTAVPSQPFGEFSFLIRVGSEEILWNRHTYEDQAECAQPNTTLVDFVDDCHGMKIVASSSIDRLQIYGVLRLSGSAEDLVAVGLVAQGQRAISVPARPGDAFQVTLTNRTPSDLPVTIPEEEVPSLPPGGGSSGHPPLIGEHTYNRPASCDPASASASAGTGAGAGSGSLPVTGFRTALVSAAGGVLLVIGVALFVVGRRRRIRFQVDGR